MEYQSKGIVPRSPPIMAYLDCAYHNGAIFSPFLDGKFMLESTS